MDDTNTVEYYSYYLITLVIGYVLLGVIFKIVSNNNVKKDKLNLTFDYYGNKEHVQVIHNELTPEQSSLRIKFLIASTLIKSAIWIKAPYMFALYNRLHGFTREEIGILYLIENLTSLLLGPVIGSLCDLFGRKKFCVMYAFFLIIQLGLRLTGSKELAYPAQFITGICSVLIDTSFESWLNFEANMLFTSDDDGKREKNSFLREVFAKQIQLDCLASIVMSGITTIIYMQYGIFYPFYFCMAVAFIAGVYIIFSWNENNIEIASSTTDEEDQVKDNFFTKLSSAWKAIKNDKPLFAVGIIESTFKISLVLWMFMWTPLLEETNPSTIHPGAIFICFMLARLIGSELFDGMKSILKTNTYVLTIGITFTATLSFFFEYTIWNFDFRLIMLLYFDGLSGIFMPLMSSLKSQMIPEKFRTTIMTFFRFPINVCAILTLFFTKYLSTSEICLICAGFMTISTVTNVLLFMWHTPPDADKRTVLTTSHIRKSSKKLPTVKLNEN